MFCCPNSQDPSVPVVAGGAGRAGRAGRAARGRKASAKSAKESSGAAYLKRKRNSKMEDKEWVRCTGLYVSC